MLGIIEGSITDRDLHEYHELILKIERQGDEILRNTSGEIYRGAVPLTTLLAMDTVFSKTDDILDNIHILSREILDVHIMHETPYTKMFIAGNLLEMINTSKKALEILLKLVDNLFKYDFRELGSIAREIHSLEEAVDDLKNHTLEDLYQNASRLSYFEFWSIISIVFNMDNAIDAIKDVAYKLLTLRSSYMV